MASKSKFFKESSESSSDEQSINEEKPHRAPTFRARKIFDDDDSDTEQKRLVRTEKDKRYGELKAIIRTIANAKKINDFRRVFDGTALAVPYVNDCFQIKFVRTPLM
ncbi:hypothetical protein GJ496_000621 [Pomphorhynchus laevis]|nr:hypothetical protein GJ496_000621 [Pomphorhynchus laevis]